MDGDGLVYEDETVHFKLTTFLDDGDVALFFNERVNVVLTAAEAIELRELLERHRWLWQQLSEKTNGR